MKYSITVTDEQGFSDFVYIDKTQEQAKKLANELANDPKYAGRNIFITFYRPSDGQTGYLNPDGNHSPTGESWNNN